MTDLESCVAFLRRLIQTQSMPGEEEALAGLVAAEMRRLGYDEVRIDEVGNVIGTLHGRAAAPSLLLNTHLDHVDVGDPAGWPHPPFAAEVAAGRVWGRGAVDIKGPLAAQVHGVGRLAGANPRPPGPVHVTAVVQEEIGGLGARHLAERLPAHLVLVGEPSSNELRRGHRGRVEVCVHATGRSVHASVPERGANPLGTIGRFLARLDEVSLPVSEDLGAASLAPTLIRTDQRSANVVPGEVWLTCDCRTIPGQSADDLRDALDPLLRDCLVPGVEAQIEIPSVPRHSYTGVRRDLPADNPAFSLPAGHPALNTAAHVLESVLGGSPSVDVWRFATDGGHFSLAGRTVVGFGPGDETLAHTVDESIEISALESAMNAYEALARDWPRAYEAATRE